MNPFAALDGSSDEGSADEAAPAGAEHGGPDGAMADRVRSLNRVAALKEKRLREFQNKVSPKTQAKRLKKLRKAANKRQKSAASREEGADPPGVVVTTPPLATAGAWSVAGPLALAMQQATTPAGSMAGSPMQLCSPARSAQTPTVKDLLARSASSNPQAPQQVSWEQVGKAGRHRAAPLPPAAGGSVAGKLQARPPKLGGRRGAWRAGQAVAQAPPGFGFNTGTPVSAGRDSIIPLFKFSEAASTNLSSPVGLGRAASPRPVFVFGGTGAGARPHQPCPLLAHVLPARLTEV